MTEPTKYILKDRAEWRSDNGLHRIDGPAIEWNDGDKRWFLNDIRYISEEEWFKEIVRRWSKP